MAKGRRSRMHWQRVRQRNGYVETIHDRYRKLPREVRDKYPQYCEVNGRLHGVFGYEYCFYPSSYYEMEYSQEFGPNNDPFANMNRLEQMTIESFFSDDPCDSWYMPEQYREPSLDMDYELMRILVNLEDNENSILKYYIANGEGRINRNQYNRLRGQHFDPQFRFDDYRPRFEIHSSVERPEGRIVYFPGFD